MALRMVTTIVGWRIYEITHNPFAIGLIGLSEFLPAFSSPCMPAMSSTRATNGAAPDHDFCYLVCVAGLILVFGPVMRSLEQSLDSMAHLSIIFCTGVIRAFAGPALNAIIAQIVPRDQLPSAVTLNTSAFLLASVLGHATAGFLIAHSSYLFCFSVVGLYAVIAWYFLFTLSPKQIMLTGSRKRPGKASRTVFVLSSTPGKYWAQ